MVDGQRCTWGLDKTKRGEFELVPMEEKSWWNSWIDSQCRNAGISTVRAVRVVKAALEKGLEV